MLDVRNEIKETRVFYPYPQAADEPTDVFWSNLAYTNLQLFMRGFVGFLLTMCVLLVSLVAVTYFNMLFVSNLPPLV